MEQRKIAVIIGSLRKGSFNRMMASAMAAIAPRSLKLEVVEIGALTLYNQDLDGDPPTEWVEFRKKVKECDGVLFFTPEYNRSMSGAMKNAIDIGSRPYGHSVWDGKPAGVVSVSAGPLGGFGANHHLRQSLVVLNVPAMPQPEAYFANAQAIFDKEGKLADEQAKKAAEKFLLAFEKWVEKNLNRG